MALFLKSKRPSSNKMAARENALPIGLHPLVGMLEMVAFKKNMVGPMLEAWVEAVRSKFADVGVLSLRDFVQDVLGINRKLHDAGHSVLHRTTLNMMLREVCDMLFGIEH
jgi:hypothetical protein